MGLPVSGGLQASFAHWERGTSTCFPFPPPPWSSRAGNTEQTHPLTHRGSEAAPPKSAYNPDPVVSVILSLVCFLFSSYRQAAQILNSSQEGNAVLTRVGIAHQVTGNRSSADLHRFAQRIVRIWTAKVIGWRMLIPGPGYL